MGNACARCWYDRISFVEHFLIVIFRKWGYFVAEHPLHVIIGALVFTALCCIGLPFIEGTSDTLDLYVPKNSVSYKNYQHYENTWKLHEDKLAPFNFFVTTHDNEDLTSQDNIFSVLHLTELLRIHHQIMDIRVKYQGETYAFEDLCYTFENGNCYVSSVLEFYDFNQTRIDNMAHGDITYPSQFSWYSDSTRSMILILGQNITINEMYQVTATPAFGNFYAVDESLWGKDLIGLFEDEYLALMDTESSQNTIFDIAYESADSFGRELNRAIGSDVPSFVISFALIGIFASFILMRFKKNEGRCPYKIDPLRNRSQLSMIGILSCVCAVFGSFGLVGGLFRVKWNPVVAVAPFLLVGLGVDDMFVLLRAYELSDRSLSIADRIALTMQRGGISILFTSITDLVAFCVGATSPFGSVSAFCLYCGVGVILDFVFVITLFLGVMVYDSRPDTHCICCVSGDKDKNNESTRTDANEPDETSNKTETKEVELATADTTAQTVSKQDEEETKSDIEWTDAVLLSYMIESESSSVFMKMLADLILEHAAVKIGILLLFVGYLSGAFYGALGLHAYQDPIDLVPSDSYLRGYFNVYVTYFDQIGRPLDITLDRALDYSDTAVFERVDAMVVDLQSDECFESEPYLTRSWVHSFRDYLAMYYGNRTVNQSLFYHVLYNEYLDSELGESYIDSIWNTIVVDDSNGVIDGMFNKDAIGSSSYEFINKSRIQIHITARGVRTSGVAKCLDNYKSIMTKYSDLGASYYAYLAVIAESDLVTIQQTIRSLVYAMIAACIISIVLIPYPSMTVFVMSTVGQILFGVLGYMSLWGLPINTTTMINVVLSVGFSVDNAAHFCHAFINAPIKDIPCALAPKIERKARVLFALNSVGMPILAGDISTIVALVPLIGADTEIFVSFWKCISLVMMFGAAYSVLYLPVVLSFIGPVGLHLKQKSKLQTEKQLELQQQNHADK